MVIPGWVNSGTSCPSGGHVGLDHERCVEHEGRGRGHPGVIGESVSIGKYAAVQTRAMEQRELKPQKPLKVSWIDGLERSAEQLIEHQRSDDTLKCY